jgi:hypothetical protein
MSHQLGFLTRKYEQNMYIFSIFYLKCSQNAGDVGMFSRFYLEHSQNASGMGGYVCMCKVKERYSLPPISVPLISVISL